MSTKEKSPPEKEIQTEAIDKMPSKISLKNDQSAKKKPGSKLATEKIKTIDGVTPCSSRADGTMFDSAEPNWYMLEKSLAKTLSEPYQDSNASKAKSEITKTARKKPGLKLVTDRVKTIGGVTPCSSPADGNLFNNKGPNFSLLEKGFKNV